MQSKIGLNRLDLIKNQLKHKLNEELKKNVPELIKLVPSEIQSRVSGGTSHILPRERAKTKFDVKILTDYLNGGKEGTKRRKFFEAAVKKILNYSINYITMTDKII